MAIPPGTFSLYSKRCFQKTFCLLSRCNRSMRIVPLRHVRGARPAASQSEESSHGRRVDNRKSQQFTHESVDESRDFFGIECGAGVKDISGKNNTDLQKVESTFRSHVPKSADKVYVTVFGSMRFDVDNLPSEQYELPQDSVEGDNNADQLSMDTDVKFEPSKVVSRDPNVPSPNFVDEQYFDYKGIFSHHDEAAITKNSTANRYNNDKTVVSSAMDLNSEEMGLIDQQYICGEVDVEKSADNLNLDEKAKNLTLKEPDKFDQWEAKNPITPESIPLKPCSATSKLVNDLSFVDKQYVCGIMDKSDISKNDSKENTENLQSLKPTLSNEELYINTVDTLTQQSKSEDSDLKLVNNTFGDTVWRTEEASTFVSKPDHMNTNISANFISNDNNHSFKNIVSGQIDSLLPKSKNFRVGDKGILSEYNKSPLKQLEIKNRNQDDVQFETDRNNKLSKEKMFVNDIYNKEAAPFEEPNQPENHFSKTVQYLSTKRQLRNSKISEKEQSKLDEEKPFTAYDYVLQTRMQRDETKEEDSRDNTSNSSEFLDSKGYRVPKNLLPDFSNMSQETIATILKKNIIYSDDKVVAVNKPYGLSVQGGGEKTGLPTISMLIPILAHLLNKKTPDPQLFAINSLEKSVTGVLLLAKTPEIAKVLKAAFADGSATCLYFGLTSRIPSPEIGVIDIPITPGTVQGKSRMHLCPDVEEFRPHGSALRNAVRAVTEYRVLSSGNEAALVEMCPKTDVKHQLRVHFGFGLGCPFIGDHKYSHLTKLAPQKLSSSILSRLGMRQSKVRHLGLHLHLRSVVLPEFKDGRNLFVQAPFPPHFHDSMKRLKLKKHK